MTIINLVLKDQELIADVQPKIASGDINSVELHVEFDSTWEGYGKSAVFFTSSDATVYEAILSLDKCVIPHEVLVKHGMLSIGIRGINANNNAIKTSTLLKYKIVEGAPRGDAVPLEPAADMYQQLMTAYGNIDAVVKDKTSIQIVKWGEMD